MIASLILAAGNSSRLGKSKQLVQFQGKTLLENTIDAQKGIDQVFVVLGSNMEEHRTILDENTIAVLNQNWQKGIGSSIKCGIRAIQSRLKDCHGILICVCDQPYLTANHVTTLVRTFTQNSKTIVVSKYIGSLGVPALFPKDCFPNLLSIDDASGAKSVINQFKGSVIEIPFRHGEIDIDTPRDLDDLRASDLT